MSVKSGPESVLFLRHPEGLWSVGWGAFRQEQVQPLDDPAFFLPDFFGDDQNPWWVPECFARLTPRELAENWPQLRIDESFSSSWSWPEPQKEFFHQDIEEILQAIEKGELNKAVAVVMSSCARLPSIKEKMQWWSRTLAVPSRFIAYGGWWEDEGIIGLSPEILFSTQEGWIETMALAGTAPHPGPSLFESEKDLREHQWVVEDLSRQLGAFGEVKKTPTREWILGRLKHLRTDLAVAQGATFTELIGRLHPTPALGVAPREAGLSILRQSRFAKSRRRFGAPFGVNIPGESGFCCVAIRGLQWHEDRTWLSAGCGIVQGSSPEREWQELTLKRAVVAEQFAVNR